MDREKTIKVAGIIISIVGFGEIGRASGRERVWQYVYNEGVCGRFKEYYGEALVDAEV